ncbi:hypothetical protein GA565_08510 [Rouxiella sp. S1S-2]|uniref:tail fiber assembly protein n=1 Tax=Rouxiella sp. S1S-2 TaxID=2653856 RepID=UPI0012652D8A|nr:tail fiber assembly protein [Rouxiella sp. S1S-2]KAB7896025.1 hypothetical protein GA565_08510 [Rouxiella sp. S1S-2]
MFQMTDKPQTIKIYNLRADTQEYIGAGDAHIPAHTGLPAHCTELAPPIAKKGTVAIFKSGKWIISEDYRGTKVYSTETGLSVYIETPGALPGNTTTVAPATTWDRWDGKGWVFDEVAEQVHLTAEAEKQQAEQMRAAEVEITLLQRAEKHGMATEADLERLEALERWTVELGRMSLIPG